MSLVSIKQVGQRRIEKKAPGRRQPVVTTGQRLYRAVCTADEPDVAEAACPVQIGDAWSTTRTRLKAIGMGVDEVEDAGPGRVYLVTVDFSDAVELPEDPEGGTPGSSDNKEVTFGFNTYAEDAALSAEPASQIIKSDGTTAAIPSWPWGRAICNSAGQPFDPSVEKVYYDQLVTVELDRATFNHDQAKEYIDAVNDGAFSITYNGQTFNFADGTARITDYSGRSVYTDGTPTWRVHIAFEVRDDGWLRNVEDRGLNQLFNGDYQLEPVTDSNGDPVTEAVGLNGSGEALTSIASPKVYIRFPLHKKKDFTLIGL